MRSVLELFFAGYLPIASPFSLVSYFFILRKLPEPVKQHL